MLTRNALMACWWRGLALGVAVLWMGGPGTWPHPVWAEATSRNVVTIRVAPGEYMPGRRPQGIGDPLERLRMAAHAYERLHPHVRIVFQSVGGADLTEGEYIRTQIMGGTAPDIIQINSEAVWPDVDKNWWLPLDTYLDQFHPYVEAGEPGSQRWWDLFAHETMTLAQRAPNGKLYSLTYDLVETGIFYNKAIFRSLDLRPPETWAEFIALQERLKGAGYVPLAVSIVQIADWGQDYLFDQLFYPIIDELDRVAPDEEQSGHLENYLFPKELAWAIKQGYFSLQSERYREMWRLMREWRDYWPRDIIRPDRTRLFVLQRAAMIWEGSWFVRRLQHDELVDFEWGVFYLPPITQESSHLAYGASSAVIGGAGTQYAVTQLAEQRGHVDQVIDFLAFLSQPDIAGPVIQEAGLFIPNVRGAEIAPGLKPFVEIVNYRYCTTKWSFSFDTRFTDTNRRLIELFLGDAMSLDAFLERMDQNNRAAAQRVSRQQGWTFDEPKWTDEPAAAVQAGED